MAVSIWCLCASVRGGGEGGEEEEGDGYGAYRLLVLTFIAYGEDGVGMGRGSRYKCGTTASRVGQVNEDERAEQKDVEGRFLCCRYRQHLLPTRIYVALE